MPRSPQQIVGHDALVQLILEGYVVVPREPTPKTIKAMEFAIYRYSDCTVRDAERGAPHVYSAALTGATAPEKD